jgi:hypothetical protein
MGQQLSRSEKRKVVGYGLVALLEFPVAIINAMSGSWFMSVIFAFLGVSFALRAVAIGSKNPR